MRFTLLCLMLPILLTAADDLVDVQRVDPTIRLDIRYATSNNFTGQAQYEAARCLLRAGTAEKLKAVQKDLAADGLGLKMYDCYRPRSVQWKLWRAASDKRFVGNPAKGSRHNRGAAVDLTLVDRQGNELPMPTPYDTFSPKAHRNYQDLPAAVKANRAKLEAAMKRHGFLPLPHEWWHFDDPDWKRYELLDVPLTAR